MPADLSKQPVFRFAPSPNGALHLGHALSAYLNDDMARAAGGRFLVRMEDIDPARCTQELEAAVLVDLHWLGLSFEQPVRRQSEHLDKTRTALLTLIDRGLAYPAFQTRGATRMAVEAFEARGRPWPRDPDGVPHYPGEERTLSPTAVQRLLAGGKPHAWRLDMAKALAVVGSTMTWRETGSGPSGETGLVQANPAVWGDVVLARADAPSSYHMAVTLDDAAQGVTHVVRGADLFPATSIHRLLQTLLDLPEPVYHHHRLILGADGRKLAKSNRDTGLSVLREAGWSPTQVRARVFEGS